MPIRNAQKITILTTGGTIDKVYGLDSQLSTGDPAVTGILAALLTDIEFETRQVLAIDSLDMTDNHRAELVRALEETENDRVLITHGTDTMPETARYLTSHADLSGKTVVLTGSMQPAAMRASDADFNIGGAVTALSLLEPGVYVAMSGRVFEASTVKKDRSRGIFGES